MSSLIDCSSCSVSVVVFAVSVQRLLTLLTLSQLSVQTALNCIGKHVRECLCRPID